MSEEPLVEGEFVTVAADYLNEVCAGTMEHMDVFVARLMERFKIDDDDLSICYRSLELDADLARIDEVFQDALGVTLDESVAEYLDTWTGCWSDPLLSECNAPEIAWDGEVLQYEEEVDCDKGEAIGPYEYELVGPSFSTRSRSRRMRCMNCALPVRLRRARSSLMWGRWGVIRSTAYRCTAVTSAVMATWRRSRAERRGSIV